MRFDAVIFDLDGTLLNTLGDIRNALNRTMDEFGISHYSLEETKRFIGGGARRLILHAMPEDSTDTQRSLALEKFQAHYNSELNVETVPYNGITDMLESLKSAGVKVLINSNKYDLAVQELSAAHFQGLYIMAGGESDIYPRKPDPLAALMLAEKCGVAVERCLYVGDSDVDIKTANNAGMANAWVSWGFRSRADMIGVLPENCFDSAEELTNYILS